ncbi:hypothetical protein FQN50_007909 [Emmonsiellopsis sp. PD_5]|nr:hypothetical protein FQN50_007909 [Emmonsiellopsis sp. PD_5]
MAEAVSAFSAGAINSTIISLAPKVKPGSAAANVSTITLLALEVKPGGAATDVSTMTLLALEGKPEGAATNVSAIAPLAPLAPEAKPGTTTFNANSWDGFNDNNAFYRPEDSEEEEEYNSKVNNISLLDLNEKPQVELNIWNHLNLTKAIVNKFPEFIHTVIDVKIPVTVKSYGRVVT